MRAPRSAGESDKSWNPTEEELCKGIEYINDYAPLSNSKNEHYLWVLLQIRDADSPLNGWPQHIVLKACANRFTGNSQAEPEYIYIYTSFHFLSDLNSAFLKEMVPLVMPRMPSFGLVLLGHADIWQDTHGPNTRNGSCPSTDYFAELGWTTRPESCKRQPIGLEIFPRCGRELFGGCHVQGCQICQEPMPHRLEQ